MPDSFTLYRFFAADDSLLYIGLTVNPGRRMEKHRDDKSWWCDVARIAIEQHPSIDALRAAERAAIKAEKPRHNIRMNGAETRQPVGRTPKPTTDGLIGRWFHSYRELQEDEEPPPECVKNGRVREWQGQIIEEVYPGGVFLVQLYSWWDGIDTDQHIVSIDDMRHWTFYTTNVDMIVSLGCRESRHSHTGRDVCGAPVTHRIINSVLGPIYACSSCITHYSGKAEEIA